MRPIMPALSSLLVFSLAAVHPASAVDVNRLPGAAPTSVYAKLDTWPQTMLAARARCAELAARSQQLPPGVQPFTSDVLRGDSRARPVSLNVAGCNLLRLSTVMEESPGNCHIWGDAKLIAADGTVTFLSDLTPSTVNVGWGRLLTDRNWQDQPLQIGNQAFARGIWVHANSDVIYRLDGKYQRLEAWVGLDHMRAAGAARFMVSFDTPDPVPAAWQQIARDFPEQAQWLTDDSGGRTHQLDWFRQSDNSKFDEQLIQRVVGQLGADGQAVRHELDALRSAKVPAGDPRWLNCYARACRYRQCAGVIAAIQAAEVRESLAADLSKLWNEQTAAEAPAWRELLRDATALRDAFAPLDGSTIATLRSSIRELMEVFPGQFEQGEALLASLTTLESRWNTAIAPALRRDPVAIRSAAELSCQIGELRWTLVTAIRGMPQYLASCNIDARSEWAAQYHVLLHDLAHRERFAKVAAETYRRDALVLDEDRDPADIVLRRTAALLTDLQRTCGSAGLAEQVRQLADLQATAAKLDPRHTEARYALYALACKLRRQIALGNPLLNFDKLLLLKRHRATFNHMCDQYYGITAQPGGGVFVLQDPFGPRPQLRSIVADARVEDGRLKGQKLDGGSFLSPSLDYDARTLYFAYVECTGDTQHVLHTDPTRGHWDPGRCYHVFKCGIDGSSLTQLTDGTFNDFDPCPLPNGRVAFITERRGGYLRCGRTCPNYTLFDMNADGGDINALSTHETNEWHPSVTHEGRIIYTRWDYVDRHGCTAHMPWVTTLDGRDARALHGNFAPRPGRPDMELDVRAVPNSPKYAATAAPHHGQAFGSLVLLDPRVPDDDAMGPVRRITPDVAFPESQGGSETYGSAWPLSEDYYLCAYDADMELRPAARNERGNYGIYLVDAWGNKELIYRDPEIASLSPIPLRPTAAPPVAAPLAAAPVGKYNPAAMPADQQVPGEGTLTVLNVYDSIKPWPTGAQIKSLRVLQLVPMSVPSGAPPHDTGVRIGLAGDSVVTVRHVLGTVPVEVDGSARFIVPANRELFFQALDGDGLAVQSMRSATYLHDGESLTCQGCHEPKHLAPPAPMRVPQALLRPPSRIEHDVDGSNPFSYPRLVQPVLDRHCASCHASDTTKKAPNLGREPIRKHWFASYNSLVPRYAFTDYGDGYRTTPGHFGAKASALYALLTHGHYDVKLSKEELHRITLWLDCASMFYGTYEKENGEAQLRGDVVRPTLE